MCCERLDDDSEGGTDILFKSEGLLLDPGVVIIGKISNIPFTILSKHLFVHKYIIVYLTSLFFFYRFDVCFSSPGLYQIYVINDIGCVNEISSNDLLTVPGFKLNILCTEDDNFL